MLSSSNETDNIEFNNNTSIISGSLPPLHKNINCYITNNNWKAEVTDLSVDSTATTSSSHTTQGCGEIIHHNLDCSISPGGCGGYCGNSSERGMNNVGNNDTQQQQQSENVPNVQDVGSNVRVLNGREGVLRRLSEVLIRGSLTLIDLSQRGLVSNDSRIIRMALIQNPYLTTLKLGYNNLGDEGTACIASAIRGHPNLSILDIGFNNVGDNGCTAIAKEVVSTNSKLKTLYLSGNSIGEVGALHLASAIESPSCGLRCLHLSANKIGSNGVKALARSIAENEARAQAIEASYGSNDNIMKQPFDSRLQELFLGGTNMGAAGCLAISNMLLTNLSLRMIDMSNNDLEDKDMALFSQSISRNKLVPLEVLRFSFNRFTCVGVENLMNAIWGSTTLKELRLDNNSVNDRGAQLVAVVLTSVKLQVIDLGFNNITTVGIKALMKSLAENDSLQSLTLSGNPLDTTASKAVSYALAYNSSLTSLFVDHCSIGYAAQRHITAGIASNSQSALRHVTGFGIGAIAVTLGLPSVLENWTNEQVLGFFRFMWDRKQQNGSESSLHKLNNVGSAGNELGRRNIFCDSAKMQGSYSADDVSSTQSAPVAYTPKPRTGPSDPTTVVDAAKTAFQQIESFGGESIINRLFRRDYNMLNQSPLAPTDAMLLERTPLGDVRIPPFDNFSSISFEINGNRNTSKPLQPLPENPTLSDCRKSKHNIEWLNTHANALRALAQQPFDNADLFKLHQYFFSPVEATYMSEDEDNNNVCSNHTCSSMDTDTIPSIRNNQPSNLTKALIDDNPASPRNANNYDSKKEFVVTLPQLAPRPWTTSPVLERKTSYRLLQDVAAPIEAERQQVNSDKYSSGGRRRNVSVLNENCNVQTMQPASKRLKKARIAYFPRIREKLQSHNSKANQHQALILMRQLKYVETHLFKGQNIYSESVRITDPEQQQQITTCDAETILVDLL